MMQIHLGYELRTGRPIAIPLRHMAVTGQTSESGKTTALEALALRAGVKSLAFVTKRGERSFADEVAARVRPYFRDRADWQFVDQLLEAQLREKNKFLRPWIMKICRSTQSLADVHREVKRALVAAKGIHEGVYTQLDAYLDLIVPEIGRAHLAQGIHLFDGRLHVMDVSDYSTPMQMLFVQSAIDWINDSERGIVTVIPEAWEFIPEGKGSPVKASAIALARKGAALGNWIWVDSQDMAGVDKTILRNCAVWLIGAQREANEIKRNLANIPAGIQRPKPADIARLGRGQFFACWKDQTVKVYVQPSWMEPGQAESIARLETPVDEHARPERRPLRRFDDSDFRTYTVEPAQPAATPEPKSEPKPAPAVPAKKPGKPSKPEEFDVTSEQKLDEILRLMRSGSAGTASPSAGAAPLAEEEALYQRFKERLIKESPGILAVLAREPELRVEIEVPVIEVDGKTLRGRLARLIAGGHFDEPKTSSQTTQELKRLGAPHDPRSVLREEDALAAMGFLTKEAAGFQAVPRMKRNIKTA